VKVLILLLILTMPLNAQSMMPVDECEKALTELEQISIEQVQKVKKESQEQLMMLKQQYETQLTQLEQDCAESTETAVQEAAAPLIHQMKILQRKIWIVGGVASVIGLLIGFVVGALS